jgi:hypothetical protein
MVSFQAWQESKNNRDRFTESRVLSIFPIERGFLITLRSHFADKKSPGDTFSHDEVTFFATLEQGNQIAHVLLSHVNGRPKS